MPVPDTQTRPAVETPRPGDAQTPPRRSRTPVRHSRGMDESRSSTRSGSPIRRVSSSESSPWDGSPVDFSAAFDTAENIKDKSLSDEEGSHRKVSSAQYQLFRQAVTSSKGSCKLNPAKSRRAARAPLLDLGEADVTYRVSWWTSLHLWTPWLRQHASHKALEGRRSWENHTVWDPQHRFFLV